MKNRVPVILGTDFWTDCDDAVAIRLLAEMEKMGYVKLIGVGINACMEASAPAVDAFLQNEGYNDIPLGIDLEAGDFTGRPHIQYPLAALPGKHRKNEECENAVKLYRRILAESDEKVDIIEIGFPQILSGLLRSEGDEYSPLSGAELVKEKVGKLYMMAGKWDDLVSGKEHNFENNQRSRTAGKIVCDEWPTEITFLGWEVGNTVISGGTLDKGDLLYSVIADHGSPNGRSSWDPLMVYIACLGDEKAAGFDTVSGKASLEEDTGINHFDIYEGGPHKFVVKKFKDRYYEDILNKIIDKRVRNAMDYIKPANAKIYDKNGKVTDADICGAIDTRVTPHGGVAYYVTASCEGGFSADKAITLTLDIPDTSEYVAIENHSPFWCRPFFGISLKNLPDKVQELLIKDGETWRAILPVCADTFKTLLCGGENGATAFLYANTENITECKDQLSFIYMEGCDPYVLLEDIARDAAAMLGNGMKMRSERKYPEAMEYLGWCSWDAFQIRVNHDGLLEKAKEFKDKGVPIGFAIIDDMWGDAPRLEKVPRDSEFVPMVQAMHASTLRSFEGAPSRFPSGMKSTVSALKESGIPYVGIWFPTTGYWSGIEEGSELKAELDDSLITIKSEKSLFYKNLPEGLDLYIVAPEKEKAARYFDNLCGKAKDFGADFVKIENQGFHVNYRNVAPIGKSAAAMQSAIIKATEKHFDGAIINCMGMPNECLFNRVDTSVCRCSDDFLPENKVWFSKNVLQCSYNGLLQGQYHVNDWDMWWTDDGQAAKNSLCRAISGGPVYVSDKLGRTNPEVLKPLILSNGRILRLDESAKPTEDCLINNPTSGKNIFKIFNRCGEAGVVAVFNINEKEEAVSGRVSAKDMRLTDGRYAYYEYFGKTGGILEEGESIDVTLEGCDDFKLYTFVPLTDGVAVMGRSDLYMGIKAVKRNGSTVSLIEGGEVTVISEKPVKVSAATCKETVVNGGIMTSVSLKAEEKEFNIEK